MSPSILPQIVLTFAVLSILSIGGANASLPEIHRQVVDHLHWMDDATFASLVAIGQTAPGPNVLIVSIIGWHMAGIAGLLLATLAIIAPSSALAIGVGRFMVRNADNRWVGSVRRALAPVAIGLMLASGVVMTRAAYHGAVTILIVAGMSAVITLTRLSPLWGIAAGAILGVLGSRLHLLA
jgi:chromate transporter